MFNVLTITFWFFFFLRAWHWIVNRTYNCFSTAVLVSPFRCASIPQSKANVKYHKHSYATQSNRNILFEIQRVSILPKIFLESSTASSLLRGCHRHLQIFHPIYRSSSTKSPICFKTVFYLVYVTNFLSFSQTLHILGSIIVTL